MPERIEDVAFILHKRAYKESSYIIDLFTRQHGIVSVIARGAKSAKSGLYLNLQLFNSLDVAYTGKSELMSLIQAEIQRPAVIRGQKHIFCGYYLNELLLRLLHRHDEHPALFDDYQNVIQLFSAENDPEPILRRFEKVLLDEIGYGIDLGYTCDGEVLQDNLKYIVTPGEGIVEALPGARSEHMVTGKSLKAFEADDYSDKMTMMEIKKMMRRILQHYLGNRPLKSRDLFAEMSGN